MGTVETKLPQALAAARILGHHQRGFEFVPSEALGGKLPHDYLLANTDPAPVKMELDICWTVAAEQDPVAYFKKCPGRYRLCTSGIG